MNRDVELDEQEIDELLAHLDDPAPRISARQLIEAARPPRMWVRWAAGVVVALGFAGAAYAAPSSPLPGWLEAAREWFGASREGSSATQPPPLPPTPAVDPSGISVDPGDALTIAIVSAQSGGRLRVALTDGSEVMVRATGGPMGSGVAPGFSSEVDRLVVENRGSSADIDVEIPRSARRVEVQVGGRRVFLSETGRVSTEVSPDPDGRYVLLWTAGGA